MYRLLNNLGLSLQSYSLFILNPGYILTGFTPFITANQHTNKNNLAQYTYITLINILKPQSNKKFNKKILKKNSKIKPQNNTI